MRQVSVVGMVEFYQSWQQSLQKLIHTLPGSHTLALGPLPSNGQLGSAISHQIIDLLGKKVFPSHLEADLIRLRELLVDFDGLGTQKEQQACLIQAKMVLGRIQPKGAASATQSSQTALLADSPSKSNAEVEATFHRHLWDIPIQFAKGVGPSRARLLEKVGVTTIEDAFWFLPWRYEDWSVITPISHLQPGLQATVDGRVLSCVLKRTSRKGLVIVTVTVKDETGVFEAIFFNQPFLEQVFVLGARVLLRGMVGEGKTGLAPLQMRGPQHEIIPSNIDSGPVSPRLIPIYHETQGLKTRQFRRIFCGLHQRYGQAVEEVLPTSLQKELGLPSLQSAITNLHFPEQASQLDQLNHEASPSHHRLAFEELLLLQLALAVRRRRVKIESDGIAFSVNHPLLTKLRKILPFQLTLAQQRVIQEINQDMTKPQSMNRLIQGDVGSGKTMVAFHAMIAACGSGYQAVLMAPTEVLSEQHFLTLEPYCQELGMTAVLIKGAQSGRVRTKALEQVDSGEANIVIGTHALLQPDVVFAKLGLVVVDEQHKFGVVQRAQLQKKGENHPDVLVMTATPIPRTLAMTAYGDLDVSVIDQLPSGRKPVRTFVYQALRKSQAYELLRKEIEAGHQAYIVYPLVEPSEKVDLLAAVQAADQLQSQEFFHFKVGLLHGRMKAKEKQAVMTAFKDGSIQILVTTTVIEVGVDVSNATVMLVEHAERFGLAQLHQLRGRVGRGNQQALCLLVRSGESAMLMDGIRGTEPLKQTKLPLSLKPGSDTRKGDVCQGRGDANQRLEVLARCHNGFDLAEHDLEIRGPGNILGTQQWGGIDFRVANLIRDRGLLIKARQYAKELLKQDPELQSEGIQPLKSAMLRKWGKSMDLGAVG